MIPDPSEYSSNLKNKILELRDLVEANIVEAAEHQQLSRHSSVAGVELRIGQEVLLNNTTKKKLDPRWTGPYVVTELKGPSTVLLRIGTTVRAVHINHVRPLLTTEQRDQTESTNWTPPLFHHEEGLMTSTSEEPLETQNDSLTVDPATPPLSEGENSREDPQEPGLVPPVPTAPWTTRSGRLVKPV